MSTTNKLYKNIGASLLPQLINIASNFILPSLIIGLYGSQINGLTSTIRTIISYISLVGAGISAAVVQALYLPVAQKNQQQIQGMLKATANMFNRCGWIYIFIVLVVSLAYPLTLNSDISYFTVCMLLVVMSISGASEFFVVGRCRALLFADQKVYVCTTIQAISLLLSLVLAVVMLKLRVSIILVQLAISMVYIFRAFLLSAYVRRNYPQYQFSKETKPIRSAVAKRNDAMIHQLSGLLVLGSQSIILSSFVSLEAASIYAVYNIIFAGLSSICGNINTAITPFLGRTFAVADLNKGRKEFNVVNFSYFVLTILIFAITMTTILPFVSIYTKNADISYSYPMFAVLFSATQIFNIFRQPYVAIINVAGHFRETRSRALFESFLCVSCSLIFTKFFGMYGVLIGTGIALGWRCIDMIVYSHKHILDSSCKKSLIRLLGAFAVVFAVYFLSPKEAEISSYQSWCLYALKIAAITLAIIIPIVLLFERKSLKSLRSFIANK